MNRRTFLGMLAAASLPGTKSAFAADGGGWLARSSTLSESR